MEHRQYRKVFVVANPIRKRAREEFERGFERRREHREGRWNLDANYFVFAHMNQDIEAPQTGRAFGVAFPVNSAPFGAAAIGKGFSGPPRVRFANLHVKLIAKPEEQLDLDAVFNSTMGTLHP
jgi:hypothetical protein